jgi:hypothetical protein
MVKLIFEPLIEDSEYDKVKIKVVYTKKEWENLKQLYESWHLELYHTTRLFNKYEADVYRYVSSSSYYLKNLIVNIMSPRSSISNDVFFYIRDYIVDDVNQPIIVNKLINLSLFRVVPQKCDSKKCYIEFVEDANIVYLPFTQYFRVIIAIIHAIANHIDLMNKKLVVYVREVNQ